MLSAPKASDANRRQRSAATPTPSQLEIRLVTAMGAKLHQPWSPVVIDATPPVLPPRTVVDSPTLADHSAWIARSRGAVAGRVGGDVAGPHGVADVAGNRDVAARGPV